MTTTRRVPGAGVRPAPGPCPHPQDAQDARAEQILGLALALAQDVREDLAAAHRVVRQIDRVDLEAVACVLAALVPVDQPLSRLAWWS